MAVTKKPVISETEAAAAMPIENITPPIQLPIGVEPIENNVIEAAPAALDAPDNTAPVAVPAKISQSALSATAYSLHLQAAFNEYWAVHPVTATWIEPTVEVRKARIKKLILERGIDPTEDFDSVAAIKAEVDAAISVERSASGIDRQKSVDLDWLYASQKSLLSEVERIKAMIVERAGTPKVGRPKSASSTDSTPAARKPREGKSPITPDIAVKMITWARHNGMKDLFLIDDTRGGYQGSYHALRLLNDGTFEKCTYDGKAAPVPTGETTSKAIYFNNTDGTRPQYSIYQMYRVRMISDAGQLVNVPGVNETIRNGTIVKDRATLESVIALFS